jgi:uncharacterized protein YlxW (UPF0749 family)
VKSQRAETDALQRRADRLRAQVSHQRDEALSLGGGDAAARLHELEAANGLDRVRGPGLTLTLTDAPTP